MSPLWVPSWDFLSRTECIRTSKVIYPNHLQGCLVATCVATRVANGFFWKWWFFFLNLINFEKCSHWTPYWTASLRRVGSFLFLCWLQIITNEISHSHISIFRRKRCPVLPWSRSQQLPSDQAHTHLLMSKWEHLAFLSWHSSTAQENEVARQLLVPADNHRFHLLCLLPHWPVQILLNAHHSC